MNTGKIEIICGEGHGKSAMAFGRGMAAIERQKYVIIIQFLKGSQKTVNADKVRRLEPELCVFRFEKSSCNFDELSDEDRREERKNILNGVNYARKVLVTGECDLLILDEVLGLVDQGILSEQELLQLLDCRGDAGVILTGKVLSPGIAAVADCIHRVILDKKV